MSGLSKVYQKKVSGVAKVLLFYHKGCRGWQRSYFLSKKGVGGGEGLTFYQKDVGGGKGLTSYQKRMSGMEKVLLFKSFYHKGCQGWQRSYFLS